ncbi:unnamed protein product, partial [Mesorhabditis belari]|uniref:Uncharacterized protein n=1 Tax=Mesorhabditis belari TaxID=2138241 RepID=A0AAF3F859_9BILA
MEDWRKTNERPGDCSGFVQAQNRRLAFTESLHDFYKKYKTSMSSVKEESKPVVSKAGKKRVHRRQRAKEQGTADSDRSNDEDESARETAAGKKRRQNPMLQTLKFARLRNVARRVIKKLLNKQKDFPPVFPPAKRCKMAMATA